MAARRRRDLLSSRRRAQDDSEDDNEALDDVGDDSQSEGSILTLNDDLANDSDASNADDSAQKPSDPNVVGDSGTSGSTQRKRPKARAKNKRSELGATEPSMNGTTEAFKGTEDVNAMMNGLQVGGDAAAEESLDFEAAKPEDISQSIGAAAGAPEQRSSHTSQKQGTDPRVDHKAKREADPAFVPTRGGFFMHDQRSDGPYHSGFPARGRGRGRGAALTGANGQARHNTSSSLPTTDKWDHDLHEFITEPSNAPNSIGQPSGVAQRQNNQTEAKPARQIGMSKSIPIGTVAVRIFLPTIMKEAVVTGQKLTVKLHTKLPDLRSPLRRDKAVRISLPEHDARYIFPSVERSFIFIPRAQRPNQQRNRSRNRNPYPQNGSRRASVFGGSSYTPSVAMSRRSSQAQDGVLSPTGSVFSRPPPGAPVAPSRPIVKLPAPPLQRPRSPSSGAITSSHGTPFANLPQGSAYPLPSQPEYREHRSSQMTMHQPRPQKQVSIATIESPERGEAFHVPQQQDQQPFHHQVPLQYGQPGSTGEQAYYAQTGHQLYGGVNGNTPLSNMPEGAINAQPFQPGMTVQAGYYPYALQQPMYYYAPPSVPQADGQVNQYGGNQVSSPMFVPQTPYFIPMMLPLQANSEDASSNPQAGMYAHESNGMVYYFDPTQLGDGAEQAGFADPASGNMMAPSTGAYYGPPPADVAYYAPQ